MHRQLGRLSGAAPALLWPQPLVGLGVPALWLFLIAMGRLVAVGNTMVVSVVILCVAALLAAQARPISLLAILIVVSPLPLYMKGAGTPLTPGLVFGIWLSLLLPRHRELRSFATARLIRVYAPGLAFIVVATLISLSLGAAPQTSADLGALWRLAVGIAIFLACLICIRSRAALRRAYVALATAGILVVVIAAVQLVLPSLTIPGLLTNVGAIQQENGLSNLRVYGPIGDYELLGEMLALAAVIAVFLALRSRGLRRLLWAWSVPIFFVGIASTSTRSSFVIFVLGVALILLTLARAEGQHRMQAWVMVALGVVAAIPVITLLQRSFGTGYLFERVQAAPTSGSFAEIIGPRTELWSAFHDQLPRGPHLLFGAGPAFDYDRYQTYPHSLPLTLVFTTGIIGAIAFYSFLATIIGRCVRTWIALKDSYAFVGGLLVVLFVLNELKIEYIRQYNYQWFIWALLGVCAASSVAREPR